MKDKERIRMLAEAERLMDEGKIPWVWAIGPYGTKERLCVNPQVMEEFQLEQGQSVNSFIMDAIAYRSLELLKEKITQVRQDAEDILLEPNFDFRDMMGDDNADDR